MFAYYFEGSKLTRNQALAMMKIYKELGISYKYFNVLYKTRKEYGHGFYKLSQVK